MVGWKTDVKDIVKFFHEKHGIDYERIWEKDNETMLKFSEKYQNSMSHDKFKYVIHQDAAYEFKVDGDQVELTKLHTKDPKQIEDIRKGDHGDGVNAFGSRGIGPIGNPKTYTYMKKPRKLVIHELNDDGTWTKKHGPKAGPYNYPGLRLWEGVTAP